LLDLKREMTEIGTAYQIELERGVRNQVGIDGAMYWPVTEQTARSRARDKAFGKFRGKNLGGRRETRGKWDKIKTIGASAVNINLKRLFFNRQFVKGAFRFEPRAEEVRVYTSEEWYPMEAITFRDIVHYNNRGDSRCSNPRASKIWPITDADMRRMEAYKKAVAICHGPKVISKIIGKPVKKKILIQLGI
jgi:hypothetical protein